MDKYTHLLFDLDHTLWDFDANCRETLDRLFDRHNLKQLNVTSKNSFFKQYLKVNNKHWSLYNENKITKEEMRQTRFVEVFDFYGIENKELALTLEDQYLEECPKNGRLIPDAIELLDKISNDFEMVIITNGFDKTQEIKLDSSGLKPYFSKVFTSESTGFKKPDPRFFDQVFSSLKVDKDKCLVIGDNPNSDILGANRYGIDSCWVNLQSYPKRMSSTYYVDHLKQLIRLF